jgi:hypothetical protein
VSARRPFAERPPQRLADGLAALGWFSAAHELERSIGDRGRRGRRGTPPQEGARPLPRPPSVLPAGGVQVGFVGGRDSDTPTM